MSLPKPLPFVLTQFHKLNARKLGVEVKRSSVKGKKLDVFKDGIKVASIGADGYWDYGLFKEAENNGVFPKGYAAKRRRLYRLRHAGEQNKKGTPGYYAWHILW